jgi:hypothetical protein
MRGGPSRLGSRRIELGITTGRHSRQGEAASFLLRAQAGEGSDAAAAHILGMSTQHKNQVGQVGVVNGNGGEFASKTFTDALDVIDTSKTAGKEWTSAEGVTYTPTIGPGSASYQVRLPDEEAQTAVITIVATPEGVRARTMWEDGEDHFDELAPVTFDQGKLPAVDSNVLVGADWGNEVVYDGIRYIPFATTSRVGVIAWSPKDGAVVVSVNPSEATDEGPGTGNAFFYVSENPAWDDLGETWVHVAFGDYPADDEDAE